MTATITTPDQFRHRREVKNLEAAVRQNNITRIGLSASSAISPTVSDTRAWNPESSYFVSTRTQIRSQFEGKEIEKPTKPLRPLWKDLVAVALFLAFLWFCMVGLPLVTG